MRRATLTMGAGALAMAVAGFGLAADDYRSLVERYAAGDHYQTVRELGRLDPALLKDRVGVLRSELRAHVPSRWSQRPGAERERLLMAAALLHTDRAWLDRQDERGREADAHLDWAEVYVLVADRIADPTPALLLFARRWYLLAALRGHGRLDATQTRHFLDEGLRRFPDDPALLLALGSLEETLARSDTLRARVEDPAGPNPKVFRGPQRSSVERHVLLKRAEAAYRRALRGDAALEEARVRLGRVLHLLGRNEEAQQELGRVVREGNAPRALYLAQLFVGRLRQEAGDLEGAVAAYRQAAVTSPGSQTANLALSQVLDQLGDRDAALEALRKTLIRDRAEVVPDGWWAYLYGQAQDADALVEDLRQQAGS